MPTPLPMVIATWSSRQLKKNDLVYVFVVNTDLSLFKTSERFELVKAGTADLKNVIVVDGGDYMVSYATFPAYFLESATRRFTTRQP